MSKTYDALVLLGQKQQAHIPLAQSLSGKVCGKDIGQVRGLSENIAHKNMWRLISILPIKLSIITGISCDLPHFQTQIVVDMDTS